MEFYGVVMNVENYRLQSLALVFERCNDSLKNHIFRNETCKPWKTEKALASTLQWSKQILDALEFIHGMAMVHRDLKLDNVLVSVLWRSQCGYYFDGQTEQLPVGLLTRLV